MKRETRERTRILEVQDLQLAFFGVNGRVEALHGVSLSVEAGEIIALVGESGSGKTALCRAALGLHANHAVIEKGRILLDGQDVSRLTEAEWCSLRGKTAAMVFQDPMSAFDPVYPIGQQIAEVLLLHPECLALEDPPAAGKKTGEKCCLQAKLPILRRRMRRELQRRAEKEAVTLLGRLGFDEPQKRAQQYPHEFSGGMLQRAAIALAMITKPRLLIADEPTTALDFETQQEIMRLLRETCRQQGCSLLFVTHDLGLAEQIADRILVMKDGRIAEEGKTEQIFAHPRHPYTKKLLGYAAYGKGTSHYHGRIHHAAQSGDSRNPEDRLRLEAEEPRNEVLLSVRELSKRFPIDRHTSKEVLQAVNLEIRRGEIVGLIGPSGIGKSTLARCIAGICRPDSGEVSIRAGLRMQMIFQDSASALNPHMTLEQIIAEPLVLQARRLRKKHENPADAPARSPAFAGEGTTECAKYRKTQLRERVYTVMEQAELEPELAARHPYDVSGGQRQRAALARALITQPDLIICDEPIASLDVSLQADIMHLLKKLQQEQNLSLLIISHDLPMVEHISDRILTL